ncbi:MAG: nuclear transport factor 2 family protein [Rhizobium sp.]|nr:nuclear transport factor 2 family protein [Rhizobium sp.]MBX9459740.1 nuclear transport factor 2 family protein [Rhizobium sp.]
MIRPSMEQRLERLEAERDILDTLYAYGHCLDAGDEAGWVDCFTAAGRWTSSSPDPGRAPVDIAGHERLSAFVANHSRRPERFHVHIVVSPRITLGEGLRTAEATSYMFTMMRHDGIAPVLRVFGRYVDQLERGDDGRWRFAWRHAEIDAATPGLPSLVGGRVRGA